MKHTKQNLSMIVIEGNVGVGKSTFLNFLQQQLDAEIIYEPNQLWQDVEGHNLLEQFFLDQKRWAYTLQSYILLTRIDQLLAVQKDHKKPISLIERSIYSGRYCFAQIAKEIGWMDGLEWCLYKKLWERENIRAPQIPAGFVYLRTPAEICFERIAKRGRFEEQPITLDYLKRIEEKYENWFVRKQGVDEKILSLPVLILDFSQDLTANEKLHEQYLSQIQDFLTKIHKV